MRHPNLTLKNDFDALSLAKIMKTFCKSKSYHITFKHEINDEVYFMYMNRIRNARITHVTIRKDRKGTDIWYVIDKNPCGEVHTKTFRESELYSTKAELLDSL